MHIENALTAGSAQLSANFDSDFTKKAFPFNGRLTPAQLDMRKLSLSHDLAGVVDATIVAQGKGVDLRALTAKARVSGHDVTYRTLRGGNLEFRGSTQQGNATFVGNLTNGPGRLFLNGSAVVAANPSYSIVVSAQHLDAARSYGQHQKAI